MNTRTRHRVAMRLLRRPGFNSHREVCMFSLLGEAEMAVCGNDVCVCVCVCVCVALIRLESH